MGSWRALNPDFAYPLWDASEIDRFGLRNRSVYDRYLREGILDGAADVARVEILHRFGGIYVDADSEAVRPLKDADWLDARFFAVAEPGDDEPIVSNAFMGSEPGHPVLDAYVDEIAGVADLRPMWRLTGPGALTEVLRSRRDEGVVILPASVFFSTTLDGEPVPGGGTYGRHFWSTTAERWNRRGGTPFPDRTDHM